MNGLLWITIAFISGSLPLSVWLGRLALGVDIRHYGDGNPGAANVYRAGGRGWGLLAVLLDFFKGAVPVGLANFAVGLEGTALVLVALAPIAGHAFSPFLAFKGGKALAVSFGVWAGLSVWVVPVTLGILMGIWLALITVEGWAVMFAMLSLLALMLAFDGGQVWLLTWAGNSLILAWMHRRDLVKRPRLRPLQKGK